MMVEYTAPVFWFFILMVGISIFVLRYKNPDLSRRSVFHFILLCRFYLALFALICFTPV